MDQRKDCSAVTDWNCCGVLCCCGLQCCHRSVLSRRAVPCCRCRSPCCRCRSVLRAVAAACAAVPVGKEQVGWSSVVFFCWLLTRHATGNNGSADLGPSRDMRGGIRRRERTDWSSVVFLAGFQQGTRQRNKRRAASAFFAPSQGEWTLSPPPPSRLKGGQRAKEIFTLV